MAPREPGPELGRIPLLSERQSDQEKVQEFPSGSLDNRQVRVEKLPSGTSRFDWDSEGAVLSSTSELSTEEQQRVEAVDQILRLMALSLGCKPTIEREHGDNESKLLTVRARESEKSGPPEFPLDQQFKETWDNARKERGVRPLRVVPPAVHKLYRVPAKDWAYLGAVRRPGEVLKEHTPCRTSTAGAPLPLHRDKGLEARDRVLEDTIQSTAHLARPLNVIGLTAAFTDRTWRNLDDESTEEERTITRQLLSDSLTLISEATQDAMECVARLNSRMLRLLRDSWMSASSLPSEVVRRVRATDLVGGTPPVETRVPFTAPVCGASLEEAYEAQVQSCKRRKVIAEQHGQATYTYGKQPLRQVGWAASGPVQEEERQAEL